MRIVAVADTHLFHDETYEVPDGDVFVHAGDMCRRGDLDELREAAAWIHSLPHRHKVIVAGNHDRGLELLELSVRGFYPYLYISEYCPFLDAVRGTPRFQAVVATARELAASFAGKVTALRS